MKSSLFLGLIFLIISILMLVFINKRLKNSNFSTFFLFNSSWIVLIALYLMDFNALPIISDFTKIYIFLYFLISNCAYIIFRSLKSTRLRITTNVNDKTGLKLLNIFLILWAIFFLYFLYTIYSSIGLSNYFFSNSARQILNTLDTESNVNISYYIYGTFYCWGRIYFNLKYGNKKKYILFIVAISLLFTAAKMNFIFAMIGSLLILFHYKKYSYMKVLNKIIPITIGFFIFLISFAIFTGKVIDKNIGSISSLNDLNDLTIGVLLYPYTYIVSTLFSLDNYINTVITNGQAYDNFFYMFIILYKAVNKIGFDIDVPSHILPFVYIDSFETNVYTFFYEILHDFGLGGTMFFGIFCALIFSIFDFNLKKNDKGLLFYLFYAYLGTACFLSIIAFKFNTTMFVSISLLILIYLIIKGNIFVKSNI